MANNIIPETELFSHTEQSVDKDGKMVFVNVSIGKPNSENGGGVSGLAPYIREQQRKYEFLSEQESDLLNEMSELKRKLAHLQKQKDIISGNVGAHFADVKVSSKRGGKSSTFCIEYTGNNARKINKLAAKKKLHIRADRLASYGFNEFDDVSVFLKKQNKINNLLRYMKGQTVKDADYYDSEMSDAADSGDEKGNNKKK